MKKSVRLVSKKRKLNIKGIFVFFWFTMAVFYVLTSVFLQSYNATIYSDIQTNEKEIATLTESINILSLNVKELSTRERIVSIVTEQGFASNPDNVVSVNNR